jgi:hypothetical protein
MVSQTAVQKFAYFQIADSTSVIANLRVFNVAYVVLPEAGFTEGYLQIDASTDLSTITLDPYVNDFFREGLQTLTLVNANAVTIQDMRNYIAVRNYSLVFSYELANAYDQIPDNVLDEFDGIKYYTYTKIPISNAIDRALILKNVVCIDDAEGDLSMLANRLVARFIVQGQTERAMQVTPFEDKSVIVDLDEVATYRSDYLTFLIKDDLTLPTPSLAYFIGGAGEPVPAYYIQENIKNQIEARFTVIIANQQPKYINQNLAALESEAQIIINNYIPDFVTEGSVTIPRKNQQTDTDIKLGFVKKARLDLSINSDIWNITGTAQKTIDFVSEFDFNVSGEV